MNRSQQQQRQQRQQQRDERPSAAVGHVALRVSDVPAAVRRLTAVGLRPLMTRAQLAIIELRGGTHIVVQPLADAAPGEAGFDLMYDDLARARARFEAAGFQTSTPRRGFVHSSFEATAPERFTLKVVDSHAGARVV